MSMNFGNPATQNMGKVAWTGGATPVAAAIDIRHHNNFGFTFEVTADIVADAVFHVEAAPASDSNVCAPGTFAPVEEVLTCVADWGQTPGSTTSIVIPAGTRTGALCAASLPCKPDAFVRLAAGAGDTAKVLAVATLSGPR